MTDPVQNDAADAEANGMTVADWRALSPEAQAWRRKHPRAKGEQRRPDGVSGAAGRNDLPGHAPEPAAPSGAEPAATPGLSPGGQGAQVVLTGDAQAAARGGLHGTVNANTEARDAAIAAGHVVTGTTQAAADAAAGEDPELAEKAREAEARADEPVQNKGRGGKRSS